MRVRVGILVLVAAAGSLMGLASVREAGALPAVSAWADEAVTIKHKFEAGQEYRFRVRIERSDAAEIPNAPTGTAPATPPAAPAPAADKPAEPKSAEPAATPSPAADDKSPAAPAAPAAPAPQPTQRLQGQTSADTEAVVLLKVTEVGDSGVKMDMVLESIKTTMKNLDGTHEFDSARAEDDKDKDNPAMQAFKPIVGGVLKLTADKDGLITAVQTPEMAIPMGSARPYVEEWIGGDRVKARWNAILHARRGSGSAKVGETWSSDDSSVARQIGGRFETIVSHTLKTVEGDAARVESTGSMRLVPLTENAKLQMEVKGSEISGASDWSLKDGLARKFTQNQKYTLQGNMQGMSIVRSSIIQVTVTRVD